jgi:Protein of unknown function (DUF1592)/Protein of unknown function (DUF1588)/Protein of unknown function (DUF1587)/Protein of unknown function (DUF1595)/Protein of unknown function (DUF1585)
LKLQLAVRHVSRVTSPISKRVSKLAGVALCALPTLALLVGCEGHLSGPDGANPGAAPAGNSGGSAGVTPADLPRPAVGTFAGPIVSAPPPTTRFMRLNHRQWENTVRDVLKLSAVTGLSKAFVAEPLRSTFDTNGAVLSVSADTFQDYQNAAESLAGTVAHDAAIKARLAPQADATTFIKNLGRRAFRRALSDAEATACKTLFDKGKALIGSGDDFADGVELVAEYLFQSPHFIYREELSTGVVNGKVPLGAYEVASKLAYAITGSMPDDALLASADSNALATRDQVVAEVKRLLATPGATDSLLDFHDQLLVMRGYDNISKKATFPGFGDGLAEDLRQEAKHFIQDIVFGQDHGFATLMTAPYTFANARVRGLYGLDSQAPAGANATDFLKLQLDPTQRAGLLTQIGFLAANGEQDTPNIIIRGVNIARKIMCAALPPPPKNVPPLPALQPNSTNRQRVELATKDAPCNGCHTTIINPLGVALEHLDGVGKYRTQDNGLPVDSTTSYVIDGKSVPIAGAVELANAIATSEQAHACYAQNMAEYLYGRVITRDTDSQLVQQGGWLSRDKESLQNLVVNLLATDAFLTRLP